MGKAKQTPLPKELMAILACPLCKGDFRFEEAKNILYCPKCDKAYPIRDDIPLLLP